MELAGAQVVILRDEAKLPNEVGPPVFATRSQLEAKRWRIFPNEVDVEIGECFFAERIP
jgi:hypothetical protein